MNGGSRIGRIRKSAATRSKSAYRWVRRQVASILKHVRPRWRLCLLWLVLAGAAAVGIWSLVNFWDWLQIESVGGAVGRESGSTTVRNISLVIAGVIALPLALWRSLVAQRQAVAAQRQAEISQNDLLNDRYQRGAATLGIEEITIRLGGIYALEGLAKEHPKRYHEVVMQLLCAYTRHASVDNEGSSTPRTAQSPKLSEDIQAVLTAIASRQDTQITDERYRGYRPNLRGSNLRGLSI